jgi:hypothetical protein
VAGIFVPVLHDAQLLKHDINLSCPANGKRPAAALRSVKDLEDLHAKRAEDFRDAARSLSSCYAYTLGYQTRDGNGQSRHHGLRRDSGDLVPIMGDRPPFDAENFTGGHGNSLNHGGEGQNVLYVGGQVEYLKHRLIPGADGKKDDIFLNHLRRIAAGAGPHDSVLGSSGTSPYPPE